MNRNRILFILSLLLVQVAALGQADQHVVQRIVDEGKNRNRVMEHMNYITKKIGPRLTSSTNLDKAYAWTMRKFKEFGCKNVHLERWGEYPVGFDRGKRQIARMESPEQIDFEFTTPAWSPGTVGLNRGPAINAPTTMDELNAVKDRLSGAWVVYKTLPPRRQGEPSEVEKALSESGIAGRVYGSNGDLVITSGQWKIDPEKLPTERRVSIRKKDMDSIQKHIVDGKEVLLEFDIENKFIKGPKQNYNVVAEIPGTERPDEVVIVSGHLDSWDGPGSEGAQDNATGTMVALEAARILNKAGARPKRTIRFILWTGEEQGLFGSEEYVKQHSSELEKISAVFVDDGGTNYQGGLTCMAEMEPMLREAFKPAVGAFPDLPMEIRIQPRLRGGGGSDHAPFIQAGVPAFFWSERGKGDYRFVHHTQNDKLETCIPEYLVQSSTNSAAASYILACAQTLLPRQPKPPVTTPSGLVYNIIEPGTGPVAKEPDGADPRNHEARQRNSHHRHVRHEPPNSLSPGRQASYRWSRRRCDRNARRRTTPIGGSPYAKQADDLSGEWGIRPE